MKKMVSDFLLTHPELASICCSHLRIRWPRQCFPGFIDIIRFSTKGYFAESNLVATASALVWEDLGEFQGPVDEALAVLSELLSWLSFLVMSGDNYLCLLPISYQGSDKCWSTTCEKKLMPMCWCSYISNRFPETKHLWKTYPFSLCFIILSLSFRWWFVKLLPQRLCP